jgi:hypothetical protein
LGRLLELKVEIKGGISLAMVEAIAPSLPLAVALQLSVIAAEVVDHHGADNLEARTDQFS